MLYRKSSDYILATIENTPYLLCYGDTHSKSGIDIKLNESGAVMWSVLATGEPVTREDIVAACEAYYETDASQHDYVVTSVCDFIKDLLNKQVIEECAGKSETGAYSVTSEAEGSVDFSDINDKLTYTSTSLYRIANLTLEINADFDFQYENLTAFAIPEGTPDQRIYISTNAAPANPVSKTIISTDIFELAECNNAFIVTPKDLPSVHSLYIAKEASIAYINAITPDSEEIFYAIRTAFLYLAAKRGLIAIHSASLLHEGSAWLFSGPSGTGKSTHTSLWHDIWGSALLNGDINLVGTAPRNTTSGTNVPVPIATSADSTKLVVYGLPWCGTSGIYTNGAWPLGGIVFLKQSPEDVTRPIESSFKPVRIIHRTLSPLWTEELLTDSLEIGKKIASESVIFELECTPTKNAAIVCRNAIQGSI